MKIKTFRGLIADGGIDIINLHTNNGSTGYRIKKLQIIQKTPGAALIEGVLKIYKIEQSTADGNIDLSDNTLLAAAFQADYNNTASTINDVIIFDNEIINQDVYITFKDVSTGESMNYYIELEQVKLDLQENTVATLKDIKNIEQRSQI